MREISLDTETTGFDAETGDRIVEIGCVELENLLPTGKTFHVYINPERDMPHEAFKVHGIGPDLLSPPQAAEPGQVLLKDKPLFHEIAADFRKFIGDAPLVIHNAAFDLRFLNMELRTAGLPEISNEIKDSLTVARRMYPNKRSSLDALCNMFKIDRSARTLHGALLDAEILAEVWLNLMGGRNYSMDFGSAQKDVSAIKTQVHLSKSSIDLSKIDEALIFKANETELGENKAFRDKHGFTQLRQ